MFEPIPGDYNRIYINPSSNSPLRTLGLGSQFSNIVPEKKWELTEKEKKIHSLLLLVNNKQDFENLKDFYKKLGEEILSGDEKVNQLQEPDFRFSAFFFKIREQIFALKTKYQELCSINDEIYTEIEKLKKLVENLMKQTEEYNNTIRTFHLNNEKEKNEEIVKQNYDELISNTVDKQIENIRAIMNKKNIKAGKNEEKIAQIMNTIKYLKQIITIPQEELVIMPNKYQEQEQDHELATKAVCVICATRSIEYCFTECGHCFCGSCADKVKNTCHICRNTVSNKIKIYYD